MSNHRNPLDTPMDTASRTDGEGTAAVASSIVCANIREIRQQNYINIK